MRVLPTQPSAPAKRLNLALVGPGAIGKTLMSQIASQKSYMKDRLGVEVALVAVAGQSQMTVDPAGMSLTAWQEQLESGAKPVDLQSLANDLGGMDEDTVVFDCTAAEEPCDFYATWMEKGVHVITPNKKLHSGPIERYSAVRALQAQGAAHYYYEASCGAGLPVLNTLKGLIEAGDEVIAVEGILSGTLSYIFNTWKAGEPFSSVVLKAKELGFTEPDPREDLAGTDVARKVIILGRECGSKPVLEDLKVDSLVPGELEGVTVPEYLEKLPEHDDAMAAKLAEAQAAGNVLRYVGKYDARTDTCSITLGTYPADHPFAALNGADNIVQIQTERYKDLPLIIRGPGAGAEVTAMGCFADLLQLSRSLGARG